MKKIFTLILSLVATVSVYSQTPPVLARWTFEAVTSTNTGSSLTVSGGSATADAGVLTAGSLFSAFHTSASTVWSNPAGNGSIKSVSSNNWGVGDYYQFQLSTTGYTGLIVAYDQTGSNTGPSGFKLQYSTNGVNYTDFQSYTIPNNSGAAFTWNNTTAITTTSFSFDLSSVPALNNAAAVYFRVTNTNTTSINNGSVATTGTGRIDNFTVSGFTIFPLSLLSFTATPSNGLVNLAWSTADEKNVAGFEIERSVNGREFISIGSTAAKNSASNNYGRTDEKPVAGVSYYRLKMIDLDGSYKYSNIVSVKLRSNGLSVYPNPVKDQISLQHDLAGKNATVSVVDFAGKQAMRVNIQQGALQSSIDATKLAPGTYMIVFDNDGTRSTKQFVKQ